MKPSKVSISCDSNPFYVEFWEPVSRIWKRKFGIEPYLFYVGDDKSTPSNEHGTVVTVKPIEGIPIHTQAQWARFHFTQTDTDSVWITSDIDMFPLSTEYFLRAAENLPDDCFVALNTDMRDYFPVCYNMAKGRVFKEVLNMDDSFEADVRKVYETTESDPHIVNGQLFQNWSADERYSSKKICEYRSLNPNKIIQFPRPGGYQSARRIDRNFWHYDENAVRSEFYLDCHSLRPYSSYRNHIEHLLEIAIG